MQHIFEKIMQVHFLPFFNANGFETKDINSETNKTLGVTSHYFYKIQGDLNRNFYFESNHENTAEKYEFKLDFGVYSWLFNQAIGFPLNDAPNGTSNTFSLTAEAMSADKSYWQTITPDTNIEAFAKALLGILQGTLDAHKAINNLDDLIGYYFKKTDFACNYDYMIRYLKITEKQDLLDSYVAKLRAKNPDGSEQSEWFLKHIDELLDTTVLKQKVANNFTKGMKVPKSWEKVLDWAAKNPHTVMGGHFEICDNSNNLLQHVVDINGNAAKKLAILGTNSADEVFCIWQKDKKTMPVVFLGEAGRAKVIAENIDDFIQLLAVGYYEIEIADYDNSPVFPEGAEHWANPKFQAFYTKTFKKEIPKMGAEIVARNTTTSKDFFSWMCENDALWKEWNS